MRTCFSLGLVLLMLFFACQPQQKAAEIQIDSHSFSNFNQIDLKHVYLDLNVNFETKSLEGKVILTIHNKANVNELVLDTRSLLIEKVGLGKEEKPTSYSFGDENELLGKALRIKIEPNTQTVSVYYKTTPQSAALQWLEPAQTGGGTKPFLYTQSQAILARTWVPCFDSPGVKFTYSARIQCPPDLMALMSATNDTILHTDGVYTFQMEQPVSSYLLALAVGDVQFRPLGINTGVYAQPHIIEKAFYEFQPIQQMVNEASKLYGNYSWKRYDVLVMPPSFPFGGMENPRLTFATPTIITGDRSLVTLIAHELAHSWSGNLVTNATWNDFWLNEGFTMYFESRIMEAITSKQYAGILDHLNFLDLETTLKDFPENHPDTHLFLNLEGRDPDEAMTDIAYVKGEFFLKTLEAGVGREKFDMFLKKYFESHAFGCITTERFVAYLKKELLNSDEELYQQLMIDQWVFGPGLPANCINDKSAALQNVYQEMEAFSQKRETAAQIGGTNWNTHEWLYFLRTLPDSLPLSQIKDLDSIWHFTGTTNCEIAMFWYLRAFGSGYNFAYPDMEKFLCAVGRRKYLTPLYSRMSQSAEGKILAVKIYEKARPTYHSVSVHTLDEVLNYKP